MFVMSIYILDGLDVDTTNIIGQDLHCLITHVFLFVIPFGVDISPVVLGHAPISQSSMPSSELHESANFMVEVQNETGGNGRRSSNRQNVIWNRQSLGR